MKRQLPPRIGRGLATNIAIEGPPDHMSWEDLPADSRQTATQEQQ